MNLALRKRPNICRKKNNNIFCWWNEKKFFHRFPAGSLRVKKYSLVNIVKSSFVCGGESDCLMKFSNRVFLVNRIWFVRIFFEKFFSKFYFFDISKAFSKFNSNFFEIYSKFDKLKKMCSFACSTCSNCFRNLCENSNPKFFENFQLDKFLPPKT